MFENLRAAKNYFLQRTRLVRSTRDRRFCCFLHDVCFFFVSFCARRSRPFGLNRVSGCRCRFCSIYVFFHFVVRTSKGFLFTTQIILVSWAPGTSSSRSDYSQPSVCTPHLLCRAREFQARGGKPLILPDRAHASCEPSSSCM